MQDQHVFSHPPCISDQFPLPDPQHIDSDENAEVCKRLQENETQKSRETVEVCGLHALESWKRTGDIQSQGIKNSSGSSTSSWSDSDEE